MASTFCSFSPFQNQINLHVRIRSDFAREVLYSNFGALLTKKSPYQTQTFIRLLSVFLLFVFVQANFIKIFHHHNSENPASFQIDLKKDLDKTHFKSLADKCDFCDFIKHQSHHFLSENIQQIHLIKLKTFISKSYFILGESRAYLLSCSNKGPPTFYSLA